MSKRIIQAMINPRFFFTSLCASLLLASPVLALKSDRQASIEVSSETAEFDEKTGIAKHSGHVSMTQGSRHLRSETLLIKRNTQQKIESLTALGSPAYFEMQLEANQPLLKAQADRLEFYPQTQKIALIKHATVTQDGHEIRGEHLIYHLDTKVLNSLFIEGSRTTVQIPAN